MSEKLKKGQTAPLETDIKKISIKLIDGFPNHPFYVFDDEEMSDLTESIRKNGLISPVIVRQKANRFELISGHRRKHACELLGHDEIACRIVEASDDEAIIMRVDSNFQRTKVLPSERAFAYKMKLEATLLRVGGTFLALWITFFVRIVAQDLRLAGGLASF